jgi:CubicO group peptidase (beta-lactamase class C family)
MMMQPRLLIGALVLGTLAAQTPQLPDTPAGRILHAWLSAMNSPDAKAVEDYVHKHEPQGGDDHIKMLTGVRAKFGGFDLVKFEPRSPAEAAAILRPRNESRLFRFVFEVEGENPPVIVNANLGPYEPAGPPPARMSMPDALAALDKEAAARAEAGRFSGAILVASQGKVVFEKAYGLADREAKVPNTAGTQFRIGSMNKMFTAVAALQLVEQGKLDLDAPIGKYLTDYPNQELASKVTLRHLLTHTGGAGDIFGPDFERERTNLRTISDYVKLYGNRPLQFQPGARAAYSNYGFILAGALIEKVSGMTYYDYVRKHVFEPAGMKSTDSLPESEAVAGRSRGYMKKADAWVDNKDTLPWRGTSAGGGYSTAGDLFRFAQALETGKLLKKELLIEATRKAQSKMGGGYGFGFGVDLKPAGYGHGGGAPGMNGMLRVLPESGIVIVVLSNLDPPAAGQLAQFIEQRIPPGS